MEQRADLAELLEAVFPLSAAAPLADAGPAWASRRLCPTSRLGLMAEFPWPSRFHDSPHLSTRQYARILRDWVTSIGLEPSAYGTHSMRRTKVAPIYKKTGNLRAVQLLLGNTKMDSTV